MGHEGVWCDLMRSFYARLKMRARVKLLYNNVL
jgi:hypothetical protein